jgi:uncharacterized protein YbaR (Trm112 family)
MKTESLGMSLLKTIGFESAAWSLRRIYCPVDKHSLVLEVGSGGNPYPRANVLLDAYEETRERHWAPLIHDRPTVLAYGEELPFKDKAFDFVIASHVLEHSPEPEKFLGELQRVASAGYIETPDAFMERINPYKDHRLEVTLRDGSLLIRKKPAWIVDNALVELYEERAKTWVTRELIPNHPFSFHVRYYWRDRINFQIINPMEDATWQPVETDKPTGNREGSRKSVRTILLQWMRRLFSRNGRNNRIDVLPLLRCPECHGVDFKQGDDRLECKSCHAWYEIRNGIYIMQPNQPQGSD